MCGIIGVISKRDDVQKFCVEGIELLQNRGYDSAGFIKMNFEGVCTFTQQTPYIISKYATNYIEKIDCIEKLKKIIPSLHQGSFTGIAHTRWATCGAKTDENAHPHSDEDNRFFMCHNGTIEDVKELRDELLAKNIKLKSETDSELIVQFIALALKNGSNTIVEAAQEVLSKKIKGTWGIVLIDKENPHELFVARNGSPLLIGYSDDTIFVSSEQIAFQKYTQNYFSLIDGEMIHLNLSDTKSLMTKYKDRVVKILDKQVVQITPNPPYRFFFEQEIHEQPQALLKSLANGARLRYKIGDKISQDCTMLGGLEMFKESICESTHLIIVGCGSSYLAGSFALKFFKILQSCSTCCVIEASELSKYDIPEDQKTVAIFISQSGETRDIYKALDICRENGVFTIGIVNVVGSLIATSVHCGTYLNIGREVAVPATKSFTAQCVALIMQAIWMSYHKMQKKKNQRESYINNLRTLPVIVGETIEHVKESCQQAAQMLYQEKFVMLLGKGPAGVIAKEGALKIKEITYISSEAFMAGEMKHGPIALIDSEQTDNKLKTKVILTILDDEYLQEMLLALSEVRSRNAYTIVITDCQNLIDSSKVDLFIPIHNIKEFTSLLSLIPYQILCLEISILKNINPDKPRNLAKTVTV